MSCYFHLTIFNSGGYKSANNQLSFFVNYQIKSKAMLIELWLAKYPSKDQFDLPLLVQKYDLGLARLCIFKSVKVISSRRVGDKQGPTKSSCILQPSRAPSAEAPGGRSPPGVRRSARDRTASPPGGRRRGRASTSCLPASSPWRYRDGKARPLLQGERSRAVHSRALELTA